MALLELPLGTWNHVLVLGAFFVLVAFLGFLQASLNEKGLSLGGISSSASFLRNRFYGVLYLVDGPRMIDHAFAAANGYPFTVSTPLNDHVMITSQDHIKEMMDAPLHQLSLHAVAKEILQPKHTMYGFEWQDQRGVEGTGFVRALRSLLTANLPKFIPDIVRLIETSFDEELATKSAENAGPEFVSAQVFPMTKRVVTKINCLVFFGEELSRNAEFTEAALEYPQAVIFAAEFLRITPKFLKPLVANLATRQHRASRTLFRHLAPMVKKRMELRAMEGPASAEKVPMDCMQWLIETSPRKNPWTVSRMIGEIMAVWFGSVHQLAMTTSYALEDLCLHRECIDPLRDEIRQVLYADPNRNVEALALLDSFVRESVRLTNTDAITGRRKALQTYTFKDGLSVAKGDWVCIPQRAMLNDPSRFEAPMVFDAFRFLDPGHAPELRASALSFTDAKVEWPIWGLGNTACPGRFYASAVLKLILVHVLERYDFKSPDASRKRYRTWRSSIVPRSDNVILFSARAGFAAAEAMS